MSPGDDFRHRRPQGAVSRTRRARRTVRPRSLVGEAGAEDRAGSGSGRPARRREAAEPRADRREGLEQRSASEPLRRWRQVASPIAGAERPRGRERLGPELGAQHQRAHAGVRAQAEVRRELAPVGQARRHPGALGQPARHQLEVVARARRPARSPPRRPPDPEQVDARVVGQHVVRHRAIARDHPVRAGPPRAAPARRGAADRRAGAQATAAFRASSSTSDATSRSARAAGDCGCSRPIGRRATIARYTCRSSTSSP